MNIQLSLFGHFVAVKTLGVERMEQSRGRRGHDPQLARAVGQTIKVLRTDQAIDRKELAQRAEISYSYLAEIERGNKPASNTVLATIARQLGLQLHELLAYAEDRLEGRRAGRPDEEPSALFSTSPLPSYGDPRPQQYPGTPSARRNRALDRAAEAYPQEDAHDSRLATREPWRQPGATNFSSSWETCFSA